MIHNDLFAPQHADIIIVGAGPVGSLAALRFAAHGQKVIVVEIEAKEVSIQDTRALALSWGSYRRLCEAGAWHENLSATAIDTVHVSLQGVWGRLVLRHQDLAIPHLGWVVDYHALAALLRGRLEAAGITVLWATRVQAICAFSGYASVEVASSAAKSLLTCRLVVLADGGELAQTLPGIRRRIYNYQQCAVVARVTTERAHAGVAYERFTDQGPLALLPHGSGFMMVWTRPPEEAQCLKHADETSLCGQLQAALGTRQGKVLSVSERIVFPLMLKQVNRVCSNRVVLIGNAAQTLHPVAAQGLNLGLRDASMLAAIIAEAADAGQSSLLARYCAARWRDRYTVVGFTHGLTYLFAAQSHTVRRIWGAGMGLLGGLPAFRKALTSHLVWGAGDSDFVKSSNAE